MKKILEQYKYKVELHMHTSPCSACAKVPVETAIESYAAKKIDAVVITNHLNPDFMALSEAESTEKYLSDYFAAKKAGEKYGITVILGMEIRFKDDPNDYLVYGIDEKDVQRSWSYLGEGIEKFYTDFKNDKNVIVQAHPYRNGMIRANVNFLDGIEVYNMHPSHNSRVAVAAKEAEMMGGIVIGGTDFHYPCDTALCITCFKELPKDSFELAAAIKQKDYIIKLSGGVILPYANRE